MRCRQSLIVALLERDAAKRLGSTAADALDVQAHPYFEGFDFAEGLRKHSECALASLMIRCPSCLMAADARRVTRRAHAPQARRRGG